MINQVEVADSTGTRSRLVLAAMQLFWDKGYNSTSIADVLQTARVNSGSLYHFFPGKTDLLIAVLTAFTVADVSPRASTPSRKPSAATRPRSSTWCAS